MTTPMAHVLRAVRGIGCRILRARERHSRNHRRIDPVRHQGAQSRESSAWRRRPRRSKIPFLRKALSLAVDGTDLQELRKMMEIDIVLAEHAAESRPRSGTLAGGYAPTIGIIGAVMGLIQVMKHLEDIKEVGHGIAVAFVATVYGVGSANIFFLPAASKLRTRMHEASLRKDMILEGVMGIVEGLNPTLIRMKLDAYNPHPAREAHKRAEDRRGAVPAGARAKRRGRHEGDPQKDGRTCEPRTLAGVLCRFHHLTVRLLRGDVRLHRNPTRIRRKDVSDSVRQALEHGQFSAAISTVLGRGKHESQKAPLGKEGVQDRENPVPRPVRHIRQISPNQLDTLQKGLDADLKGGKLQIRLDARGLIISMREKAFFASGDERHRSRQPADPGQDRGAWCSRCPTRYGWKEHTDARPIHTSRFHSNWELSAARSIAMLRIVARSLSNSAVKDGHRGLRGKLSGRHQRH